MERTMSYHGYFGTVNYDKATKLFSVTIKPPMEDMVIKAFDYETLEQKFKKTIDESLAHMLNTTTPKTTVTPDKIKMYDMRQYIIDNKLTGNDLIKILNKIREILIENVNDDTLKNPHNCDNYWRGIAYKFFALRIIETEIRDLDYSINYNCDSDIKKIYNCFTAIKKIDNPMGVINYFEFSYGTYDFLYCNDYTRPMLIFDKHEYESHIMLNENTMEDIDPAYWDGDGLSYSSIHNMILKYIDNDRNAAINIYEIFMTSKHQYLNLLEKHERDMYEICKVNYDMFRNYWAKRLFNKQ